MVTNADCTVKSYYEYDAFGNQVNENSNDNNPFRYAGQYFDSETGDYYLRARYYDPLIGRFTQADTHWNIDNMIYGDNPVKINERENPYDPYNSITFAMKPDVSAVLQSGNLYGYCFNTPLIFSDFTGDFAITTIILIASVAIGVTAAGYTAYKSYQYTGKVDWQSTIINGLSWGLMAYTCGMSAYAVYLDYCNYYGYVPVTEISFNSNASVSTGSAFRGGDTYLGVRDSSADFKNGTALDEHFSSHGKEMGFQNATEYRTAASKFLTGPSDADTLSFTTSNGTYFRYSQATNEFGIINSYGGISTYFKPNKGLEYWTEQVNKYANT